jgi:hypothetical protein
MKKLSMITFAVTCALGFASCTDNPIPEAETQSASIATNSNTSKVAVGPWLKQFEDKFDINDITKNKLQQWTKAQRADYNSKYCNYDSSVPTIQTRDGKGCLEIKATKLSGTQYKSGLIKSNYKYNPEDNTEYMLSAVIKLVAMNGQEYKSFQDTYGAWPAFWTVEENTWPVKGEIDILEGYSFAPNKPSFTSNLFYGTIPGKNILTETALKKYSSNFDINGNSGWHLYRSFWKKKNGVVTVTIQVDNITVATYTNSSATNLNLNNFGPHNIILNMNVGSNDSNFIDPNKINLFSAAMMWVDDVSVYKRTI